MVTAEQRLEDTLGFLSGQLNWGWLFLKSAKALHHTNWAASTMWFRRAAYQACLNEAVLVLAKLVIPCEDSITFSYLLNQAENNPGLFEFAHGHQLEASVERHRQVLEEHELVPTIKTQRDKVLAHFDKKHINDPSVITSLPVNMTEVESCYEELVDILNVYKGYHDDSQFHLGLVEQSVRDDVEYIATLIQQAND